MTASSKHGYRATTKAAAATSKRCRKEPASVVADAVQDTHVEETATTKMTGCSSSSASPLHCVVAGDGIHRARVKQHAQFVIEVLDEHGERVTNGGNRPPVVAVRGGSFVRARVKNNEDGTYTCTYKPSVSGQYKIAVSISGISLPGSPFAVSVVAPSPCAELCEVRGEALTRVRARTAGSFEIWYRDALGEVAAAEELDVYVEEAFPQEDNHFLPAWSINDPTGMPTAPGNLCTYSPGDNNELKRTDDVRDYLGNSKHRVGDVQVCVDDGATDGNPKTNLHPTVETLSYCKVRVEVASKPLIIREEFDTASTQIGTLRPGQLMYVLEERMTKDGDLRAQVSLEMDNEGGQMLAQSWFSLPKQSRSAAAVVNAAQNKHRNTASVLQGHADSLAMAESPFGDGASGSASFVSASPTPPQHIEVRNKSDQPEQTKKRRKKRKTTKVRNVTSIQNRQPLGWVTIVKSGNPMVRKRIRLEAGQRQQHKQQWARRVADDKIISGSLGGLDSHGLPRTASKVLIQEKSADPTKIGFAFGGIYPGSLHAHGQLHESHTCTYSVGKAGRYRLHVWLRNQALPIPGSPFDLSVEPGAAEAQATRLPEAALPLRGIVGMKSGAGCRILLQAADQMGNACDSGGALVRCSCMDERVKSKTVDKGNGTYDLLWLSTIAGTFQVHVTIDGVHVMNSPAKLRMLSTDPKLNKTEACGIGLHEAMAGKPTSILLTFFDEFGNVSTPLDSMKIGLSILPEAKKKHLYNAAMLESGRLHDHQTSWQKAGVLQLSYVAKTAGFNDLYIWSYEEGKNDDEGHACKTMIPGSPFKLSVIAGNANVENSEMDGYIRDVAADKPGGKHSERLTADYMNDASRLIVGDTITIRPKVLDQFGNPGMISEKALSAVLRLPDDTDQSLVVSPQMRGGVTTYNFCYTPTLAGKYEASIYLHEKPIQGSPICFHVAPDYHDTAKCYLIPPDSTPLLTENTYVVVLQMCDAHGNKCMKGGDVVSAKLGYIKQGVADSTSLTPANHSITVEDRHDGTYAVSLSVALGKMDKAPWPIGVTVEVNLDRDAKERPTGIQISPLELWFQKNPAAKGETGGTLQRSGKLVMSANQAIKAMTPGQNLGKHENDHGAHSNDAVV